MNANLIELGVRETTLSLEEKTLLEQNGFLNLGKLLSDKQLQSIRTRINTLLQMEGQHAGRELLDSPYIRHPTEEGVERLADLVNKGEEFDIFYTHPKVLAAMVCVLGDAFRLSSLNYRAAKPGHGQQKLHVDWHEKVAKNEYKVCNSIWLLDDFSEANGATRVVPGTHLIGQLPQDVLEDPLATHPDEVLIEAPAGSVFVFNSHTWHGGTINNTDQSRRAIHSYFCAKAQPQQIDQKRYIQEATRQRLPKAALEILDV